MVRVISGPKNIHQCETCKRIYSGDGSRTLAMQCQDFHGERERLEKRLKEIKANQRHLRKRSRSKWSFW